MGMAAPPDNQPWQRKEVIGDATLYLGDCLQVMPTLSNVDAMITDPPYGITSNKWDIPVSFNSIWEIESNVFIITASQPFSSALVMSKPQWFKHEWIWIKNRGSNFANTVREPMKEHESVLVFSPGKWTYNKQMQPRTGMGGERVKYGVAFQSKSNNYREFEGRDHSMLPPMRVPSSWQKFNTEVGLHPTQKPVALMEYLIRTYSNKEENILDPFMGSGTTGVACVNLGRKFIGIEIEERYFNISVKRIRAAYNQGDLFREKKNP